MEVRRDPEGMVFRSGETGTDTAARARGWDERDQSAGRLVGDLTSQVAHLARLEARLAAREVADKARSGAKGGSMFALAAVIALYGGAAVAAAGVAALALVWPAWLAALVGGVGLLAIAGAVALLGWRRVRRDMPPVPEETLEGAREDLRAMRGRMEP